MTPPRFPVSAVRDYVLLRWPSTGTNNLYHTDGAIPWYEMVGLDGEGGRQKWHRMTKSGYLSTVQADEIATLLGVHPVELWGDYWIDSAADEPLCFWCRDLAPFATRSGSRAFCSKQCLGWYYGDRERREGVSKRFMARLREITARVAAMNQSELEAWLGVDATDVNEGAA